MILLPLNENTPTAPAVPGWCPSVQRSQGLGGIFDEWQLIAPANLSDEIQLRTHAEQVDNYNRFRQMVIPGSSREEPGQQLGIGVPRGAFAVKEHRARVFVEDGVRAGGKGQRRGHDFVVWAHAYQAQGQVEAGRARAQGHRRTPNHRGKTPLQLNQVRTDGRKPIGVKRGSNIRQLGSAHMRDREQHPVRSSG